MTTPGKQIGVDKLRLRFVALSTTINVLKDIDKKIILQHTPKQGSAVYFEGHQYHAGNTPIKYKHRYVINFDFTI